MYYRIFYIFILLVNLLIGQSFFNKSIGNEIGFQSARSYGIGQTHFMNSNTSVLALRNPAQLGFLDKGIKVDFNLSGFMYSERRSLDLQDYFGDFLTEGDYVLNNNFYNYSQFGVLGNYEILFMDFGFAISHGPWSSIDYRYQEEVRGSASYDDGIIGIRDPIVGYHILEHDGQIDLTSFALGLGINKNISFGLGVNYIHKGSYNMNLRSFQIGNSSDNLAPYIDLNLSSNSEKDIFPSISGVFKKAGFEISLGYEKNAIIRNSSYSGFSISDSSGLPYYITALLNSEEVDPGNPSSLYDDEGIFELAYNSIGFSIEKPEKIKMGLSHQEGSSSHYRLFSLEIIKNNFLDIENYIGSNASIYRNYYHINIGVEHSKFNKIFRMGLSYKQPSFQVLSPLTTFCFGTSKEFNNVIFDIGASYSYQKYQYQDLFPVQGDVRPDFDSVHESNWSLVSTISYKF